MHETMVFTGFCAPSRQKTPVFTRFSALFQRTTVVRLIPCYFSFTPLLSQVTILTASFFRRDDLLEILSSLATSSWTICHWMFSCLLLMLCFSPHLLLLNDLYELVLHRSIARLLQVTTKPDSRPRSLLCRCYFSFRFSRLRLVL